MNETSPTWMDELPREALMSVLRLMQRAAAPDLSPDEGAELLRAACQFVADFAGQPAAVLVPGPSGASGPERLQVVAPDPAFLPPIPQVADRLRGGGAEADADAARPAAPRSPGSSMSGDDRSSAASVDGATLGDDLRAYPLTRTSDRLPALVVRRVPDSGSEAAGVLQAAAHVAQTVWARLPGSPSGDPATSSPATAPEDRRSTPVAVAGPSDATDVPFGRPDAILIATADGVVRYANPAAAALCLVEDAADVIGLPVTAYLAPDVDAEKVERRKHQVLVERRPTPPVEYEVVREDGSRRAVQVRSTPVTFNGEPAAEITIRDMTERRTLQRRLRETEERIARLIETALPIVFILDAEGRFLVSEGRDLASTPYAPGELVGASVFDVYADAPDLLRAVRRASAGETVDEVMALDGHMYDVWLSPITDDDNRPSGCIGMAVDVTERLQAEESLRAERDLLSRIFETSPVAITVLDTEGNIKQANARAQEVLGLTPSDLKDRSYDDPTWRHTTVGGDPLPDEQQPFRMVKESEAPVYDVRHAIEWPDGRRRMLSINGAPLRDGTGSITGAVFVVEDVSAEYSRRRVARQRQDKVRALYEAVSRLLTLDTPEAVADRMLTMIEATMGYEISAVRLRKGEALEPTSITDGVRRHMLRPRPAYKIDGDSVVAHAFRDGETRMYADVRTAEDDVDRGNIRSVAYIPIADYGLITVGTTHPGGLSTFDVQLVEILARNAETVFRRLSDEAELREARDVAEEASRLKSAMLANMSHEVRTPLTSILGFAEIIEEETDEPTSRAFARRIRMGSLRLRDTLDSVLHLARLEADAMTPQLQPVDLVAEASATRQELAPMARRAGVDMALHHGSTGAVCSTDPFAVQRILRNLVGNAIKFTGSGGRVDLTVSRGRRGTMVEVSDTGIGMTADFQRRMFDAFTQESEGIRREHEGSGLGLAIVRKLVDLVGGDIEVESTRGHGTRIAIFFPGADVPEAGVPEGEFPEAGVPEASRRGGGAVGE